LNFDGETLAMRGILDGVRDGSYRMAATRGCASSGAVVGPGEEGIGVNVRRVCVFFVELRVWRIFEI
jgi:hypothetical protein